MPLIQAITYIGHLLCDMSNAVQTPKTIHWVDKTSDEADDIVFPTSIVDPRPEDKLWISMGRGAGNHCNHHHNPSDLKIEEREPIQGGDDPVPVKDNGGADEVEALIDDGGLPGLDLKRFMV